MNGRFAVAVSALLMAACAEPTSVPSPAAPISPTDEAPVYARGEAGGPIPDQYIVVFDDDVADVPGLARQLNAAGRGTMLYTYTGVLKGFAARMSAQAADALRTNPNVAYVEQDQEVTLAATQSNATWGIDRIDQRSLPLSGTYTYNATASAVRVYIIDTGIYTSHTQFGGRASNVYDAFGGNGQDCNGHGTHVAGTVGASTYGVAKAVRLRGVRVLNCSGSGSWSGIIAGMDWVRLNHIKPAVANMSLGGGYSGSVNTAANNLASAGVFVVVAAGNSSANACNYSPASASNVTSVMASTRSDARASYSNYGSCTHLYAPGSSITSTWLNGGTNTISGTSMASPHVAGVAALYKATFGDASYSTIRSWLINNSTTGVITSNPSGTPNRLVYKSTL